MGVSAAVFESAGKRTEHYVPGVYSRSYNISSPSSVSSGNLCILASSSGGEPKKLLEFGGIAEAKETLVSGDLLESVGLAFSGSNDYIPQKVFAMRVNNGTPSQLEILSQGDVLMTLKSRDFGTYANQMKMKIENGAVSESKKVSFSYKDQVIAIDNIIKKSILITSNAKNASVSIDKNGVSLNWSVETASQENPDEKETVLMQKNINISFEDFPKLSSLVNRINTEADFSATIIDNDEQALSSDLDFVQDKALTKNAITLFSNMKAFVEALRKVEYVSSIEIGGNTRQAPENMEYTYFSGGISEPATISDWNKALEALETEDVQIIATPSSDPSVQSLIAAHCSQMATTVNRKERTCILGGPLGMSDSDAISIALGLNNKLVSFVVDNVVINNPFTGNKETISGAKLAVMLAGMESAMSVNTPLTNKALNVLEFSKKRTITNIENLIRNGIMVCNPSPDEPTNYICIRGLTTYQNEDLISNERSMVREDLYMNRDLRKRFAAGIGGINRAGMESVAISTLNDAAKEWADLGYIIPNGSDNVWNKKVKVDGDKIYITFSRYLTAPTNFIFITAANHIYTSTVEI